MSWDDGTHAKVKKIELTYGDLIYSIQVTYEGTTVPPQLHGTASSRLAEFTLDPDEYITALSSYGEMLGTQEAIMALTFTTNKKTYGPYGNTFASLTSTPEATGKQIAGFFGTSGSYLNSINAHYAPIPTGTGTGMGTGNGTGTGTSTGTSTGNGTETESGTGVGTDGSGTGTGTGTGTASGTGIESGSGTATGGSGPGTGTGTSTNTGSGSGSGAEKIDAQGGTGGTVWDDGADQDGVTKIYVRQGALGIQYVKFDYVKAGQPIIGNFSFSPSEKVTANSRNFMAETAGIKILFAAAILPPCSLNSFISAKYPRFISSLLPKSNVVRRGKDRAESLHRLVVEQDSDFSAAPLSSSFSIRTDSCSNQRNRERERVRSTSIRLSVAVAVGIVFFSVLIGKSLSSLFARENVRERERENA